MSDKPGVVVPEIPPRPVHAAALIAFALALFAFIALLLDRFKLGTWLAAGATVASGVTFYLVSRLRTTLYTLIPRESTQTPGIDPHRPTKR